MAFLWLLGAAIAIMLFLVGVTWAGFDATFGSGGGPGPWLVVLSGLLAIMLGITHKRALKDRWPD
jgi:hypothetical protein